MVHEESCNFSQKREKSLETCGVLPALDWKTVEDCERGKEKSACPTRAKAEMEFKSSWGNMLQKKCLVTGAIFK